MAEERGLGGMMWQHIKRSTTDALKPFKTREEMAQSERRFKEKGAHIGRGLADAGNYLFVDPAKNFLSSWDKGMKDVNSLNVQDIATLQGGLLSLSGSSPNAGVANIGRKEARDALVQGMAHHGLLKRYHGNWYNPIDWLRSFYNKRHRANTRRLLQDVNRLPQEMLDPIASIEVKKLRGAYGQIENTKDIKINPNAPQRKVHTVGHEVHHGYTKAKKLGDLTQEEGLRTKAANMLSMENMAYHRSGTYNKKYSKIGFEEAASRFEDEMDYLNLASSQKDWMKAYDDSLVSGLKKLKAGPYYEMVDELSGEQLKRSWNQLKHRREVKAQNDWYKARWDKINKEKGNK